MIKFNIKKIESEFKMLPLPTNHYFDKWPYTEFECKIFSRNLKSLDITNIKTKFKLDGKVIRKETHDVYIKDNYIAVLISHYAEISGATTIKESKQKWIKIKSDTHLIQTPHLRIPILVRKEIKLNPKSRHYTRWLNNIENWYYLGKFDKTALDISFWYDYNHYTMTIANAYTHKYSFSQMEIEYDGPESNNKNFSRKMVYSLFDKLFQRMFGDAIPPFETVTKAQWLSVIKNMGAFNEE
ncbi:MAG: hypothetical protein M1500_01520 [Candidatus Marsarchaeota archaeon]|nr:hypothetical protein [Candidatus Marsarchaeota archaeon]